MNLDTLKPFDSAAVNGILAAAALAAAPSPGVGEPPLVLQRYGREAAQTLAEIRRRLNIKEADSPEARAEVSRTVADTLRQALLMNVNTDEVLSRVGRAGQLAPVLYNVVQSRPFAEVFYRTGLNKTYVEDAVKHPDDHQHLLAEGMPEDWRDMSLFMKRILSRDPRRQHWLLVQTHRTGIDQHVQSAWQVYPDDVNIESAREPLDVLKAFVEVYGIPLTVGNTTGLFIESERHVGGPNITIATTAPPDHYLSASSTTDATGTIRVGIAYCIDMPRYKAALEARGVKVQPMPTPAGRTFVQTRSTHLPEPAV